MYKNNKLCNQLFSSISLSFRLIFCRESQRSLSRKERMQRRKISNIMPGLLLIPIFVVVGMKKKKKNENVSFEFEKLASPTIIIWSGIQPSRPLLSRKHRLGFNIFPFTSFPRLFFLLCILCLTKKWQR